MAARRMLAVAWSGAALFARLAPLLRLLLPGRSWGGRPHSVPSRSVPARSRSNVLLFSGFALHHSVFARPAPRPGWRGGSRAASTDRPTSGWPACSSSPSASCGSRFQEWRGRPPGWAPWLLHGVQLARTGADAAERGADRHLGARRRSPGARCPSTPSPVARSAPSAASAAPAPAASAPAASASRNQRPVPLAPPSDLPGLGAAGLRRADDDLWAPAVRGNQHAVPDRRDPLRGALPDVRVRPRLHGLPTQVRWRLFPGVW